MINYKKHIFLYFSFSIVIIIFMNLLSSSTVQHIDIPILGFEDVITIFTSNTAYILIGFLLAPLGLPIIMVVRIPFIIGSGPAMSNIDPLVYYSASFIHGISELIVGCFLYLFILKFFILVIKFMNKQAVKENFYQLYLELIMSTIPKVIIILLVSAFIETFVSNPLIRIFT